MIEKQNYEPQPNPLTPYIDLLGVLDKIVEEFGREDFSSANRDALSVARERDQIPEDLDTLDLRQVLNHVREYITQPSELDEATSEVFINYRKNVTGFIDPLVAIEKARMEGEMPNPNHAKILHPHAKQIDDSRQSEATVIHFPQPIDLDPEQSPVSFSTELKTSLFDDKNDAKFWLGMVAEASEVAYPPEFHSAKVLRANIYIDKCNFLPVSARRVDGSESDSHDLQAAHFSVVENRGSGRGNTIGNIRLISKLDEGDRLPIEYFFPEAFVDNPSEATTIEASRFIAAHPDKFVRGAVSISLMRSATEYAISKNCHSVYAVIEEPLQRRFAGVGMPHEIIAETKPLKEYNNTKNMAIKFNPFEVVAAVQADSENSLAITPFFNAVKQGESYGLYGDYLLEKLD